MCVLEIKRPEPIFEQYGDLVFGGNFRVTAASFSLHYGPLYVINDSPQRRRF